MSYTAAHHQGGYQSLSAQLWGALCQQSSLEPSVLNKCTQSDLKSQFLVLWFPQRPLVVLHVKILQKALFL